VDSPSISMLELVERRIALLLALSQALTAASESVVGFDLTGLEARIIEQERICTDIAALDRRIDHVQARLAKAAPPGRADETKLGAALMRLRETQDRVKSLNRSHQLLLQRSRRTACALLHSYQSFVADIYENPAAQQLAESAV
jgi:hypothetical protein